MIDTDERHLEAIEAICKLASSNFPSNTDVRLSVDGNANGSVRVPGYLIMELLKRPKPKAKSS